MMYNNELKIINTEEKAYLLGFMYGDGSISTYLEKGKIRYQSRISVSISDKSLITKLNKIFPFFTSYTFDYSKYNENSKKQIYLTNRSKNLYDDFLLNGVLPRKSYENKELLSIPNIGDDLIHHFIRGFFDADGSVYKMKYRKNLIKIEITSNSHSFINQINNILNKNNINSWKIVEKPPTGKGTQTYFVLSINKQKEIHKFKSFIYDDATIYLKRKYDILHKHKIVNKVFDRQYKCVYCKSYKVYKNGKRNNKFRLKCKSCGKNFTINENDVFN